MVLGIGGLGSRGSKRCRHRYRHLSHTIIFLPLGQSAKLSIRQNCFLPNVFPRECLSQCSKKSTAEQCGSHSVYCTALLLLWKRRKSKSKSKTYSWNKKKDAEQNRALFPQVTIMFPFIMSAPSLVLLCGYLETFTDRRTCS